MDDRILALLESSNPEDRKRAIKAMAKNELSEEALRKLAAIYKSDPDPDVQKLALAAGKRIRQNMKDAEWLGTGAKRGPVEKKKMAEEVEVDATNASRANQLLDRAMNLLVSGDYDKARDLVFEAYELNPNVVNDDFQLGIISSVLEVEKEEAVAMLKEAAPADAVAAKGGEKRKRKAKTSDDDVSLSGAIIDLTIYGVANAGMIFLAILIGTTVLLNMLTAAGPEAFANANDPDFQDFQIFVDVLRSLGPLVGLIYGVIYGAFSVLWFAIWLTVIHFVSTSMLSGKGTWAGLVRNMTIPTLLFTIISYVVPLFYVFFFASNLSAAMSTNSFEQVESALGTANLMMVVLFALSIGMVFYQAHLVGQTYQFGLGSGCASLIISAIGFALLSCACSFAFQATMANMFTNAFGVY